ncbi:conserved protein of unknown function [Bartonella clarridgeiae 73]|uniref:Cell pole-organizing protein PopZ n=1 Tax=Bartonella clarridgeiae (strain CCUG 45776 / CIP 104772 / 73) TaxID=696125 RepID=E6YIE2_BARC7|nr:DUF2497 domain-containing protein [Bartonella clarridgeiae]WCR54801.1 MAG: hypothetical protein PG977_000194 [Bartonella clarridgeiae]CBI76630.1 conserved protein of unknown function [Bartonella clarridgeiae 73]
MVQSSNALHEPNMDEILTSIREIIEENSVRSDDFSSESIAENASAKSSIMSSESIYDRTLSVDDAMKALADRIGFSAEDRVSSLKADTKLEDNIDMERVKLSSEEQDSIHKVKQYDEAFVSQKKNTSSDCVELSAYVVSSAEKVARDVLRPAIAEWLQCQLPILLEKILREEIVKTLKNLP